MTLRNAPLAAVAALTLARKGQGRNSRERCVSQRHVASPYSAGWVFAP